MITLIEAFQNAKSLLETHGWIQNNYKSKKGYDLTGSLSYGIPEVPDHNREAFYEALELLLELLLGPSDSLRPFDTIREWNDTQGRTKAEVLELLDQAIEKAGSENVEEA